MMSDASDGSAVVRFTLWWYRLTMATFYLLVLAVCFATKLSRAPVVTLPLAMFAVVMLVRHTRGASVALSNKEIVIYGLRTRRIAWANVLGVCVAHGSSVLPIKWRVPSFQLDDGSTVKADEIRSLRKGTIVDRVVDASSRHISA
jgi:hypothetical protein